MNWFKDDVNFRRGITRDKGIPHNFLLTTLFMFSPYIVFYLVTIINYIITKIIVLNLKFEKKTYNFVTLIIFNLQPPEPFLIFSM